MRKTYSKFQNEHELQLIAEDPGVMFLAIDNNYPKKAQGRNLKKVKRLLSMLHLSRTRNIEMELTDRKGKSLEFKITFCG